MRDRRIEEARARIARVWRYSNWRILVIPACVIGAVVAVAPRAGSPIAVVAGLAGVAAWWAVGSQRRAVQRSQQLLAAADRPATTADVLARIDRRLGLLWVGPLDLGRQQIRRAGPGWTPLERVDGVRAQVDGLLACTHPDELADGRSMRDGSTLVLYQTDELGPLLIVTSGPPLPAPLARSLVQLLARVPREASVEESRPARAA
jgi:hypothetical protein